MGAGIGMQVIVNDSALMLSLARLRNPQLKKMLDAVGAVVESQTKRRIQSEKTSPEGNSWEAWSPAYAKTRHSNQSLLINTGQRGLLGSITHNVSGTELEVGTNLVYSGVHQYGHGKIPARPYLGVSSENQDELEATVEAYLRKLGA